MNDSAWFGLAKDLGLCGSLFIAMLVFLYHLHRSNMQRFENIIRMLTEHLDWCKGHGSRDAPHGR